MDRLDARSLSTVSVFAYGSNLCVERIRARVQSVRVVAVARLDRHVLRFHKRGRDGSAKADAWSTGEAADHVWGVVYDLSRDDKTALDRIEGVGRGYHDCEVRVFTREGDAMTARVYKADPAHIDASLVPYSWYRDFVLHGAQQHDLPGSYVAGLDSIEIAIDPDAARHQRETAVLETAAASARGRG